MLNIVCVKWGDLYSADYVNKLYAMVARNLAQGTPGRFVCFTDDDSGIRQEINCRPLMRNVRGWWNKLSLFAPGQFEYKDRIFYFDLDTVIISALDEIVRYDGKFAILRDFYRKDGWQSSVMAWEAGFGRDIWQRWDREGRPEILRDSDTIGDQAWIERVVDTADILQDLYPGKFVSYKVDCLPYPPDGTAVVCFHGQPKPHNAKRLWVETMWSESNVGHFDLAVIPNVSLETLRKQAKHSATLDVERLKPRAAHDGKVAIIGGGPSAGDPISRVEISNLRASGCAIWALNGSYDWLLARGVIPDAHVILDARPENARFLHNSRPETTYYIASICNWVVYDTLMREQRNVVRYDLDAMGDCGTTVGTYALTVAFIEGFREIHLFGYDSSFRGEAGHAYEQAQDGDVVVDAYSGDKKFKAASWMVRQAQDFQGVATALIAAGGTITVHGDGLLPYMAQQMMGKMLAAQIRATEILKRLPEEGPVWGAEIGVCVGDLSARLLERGDLLLLMVDSWEGDGAAYISKEGDAIASLSQPQQDRRYEQTLRQIEFAGSRAEISRRRSLEAAPNTADHTLDFVFIDADHSYEGCSADIKAWAPKIRSGGLLSGHDYDNPDYPFEGVKQAVDEYAAATGRIVELGDDSTWFIRL